MTKIDAASLRREYRDVSLDESDVDPDPVEQFRIWFEHAVEAESRDPSGLTLATANAEGRPSGRIVLLKGFDRDGFVFYSNYESAKARELDENPHAAMIFWWSELDRQVRIRGRVARTTIEQSRTYFATRPRRSQISAVASPQSRVIESRQALVRAVEKTAEEWADRNVPCPETWGGYRLVPDYFEFWQGRPNRLHDRISYRPGPHDDWIIERLAP